MTYEDEMKSILQASGTITNDNPRSLTSKVSGYAALGAILGTGIYQATQAYPLYKAPTSQLSGILESNKDIMDAATKEFAANMETYGKQIEESQVSGLEARGISDKGVTAATRASVQSSISSARAAASNALEQAKMRATNQLSSAVANYQIEAMNKQYESAMAEQAAKQGLWGAVAGTAATMAGSYLEGEREAKSRKDFQTSLEMAEPVNVPTNTDDRMSTTAQLMGISSDKTIPGSLYSNSTTKLLEEAK